MLYQIIARDNRTKEIVYSRLFTNKTKADAYGAMLWKNLAHDVYIERNDIERDCDNAFNTEDIKTS